MELNERKRLTQNLSRIYSLIKQNTDRFKGLESTIKGLNAIEEYYDIIDTHLVEALAYFEELVNYVEWDGADLTYTLDQVKQIVLGENTKDKKEAVKNAVKDEEKIMRKEIKSGLLDTVEVTNGRYYKYKDKIIAYELEYGFQGFHYTDRDARGDEVAYIGEYNSNFKGKKILITAEDIKDGISQAYTYNDLEAVIKEFGYEDLIDVETLLEILDWQAPESFLNEFELEE